MAVKVDVIMAADGTGDKQYSWGESHILMATPDSLQDNKDDYKALATARMALCGSNVRLVQVRASRPDVRRDVYNLYATDPDAGLQQYGGFKGLGNFCAQPNDCLRVRHQAGDTQWGFIYLAGIPQALFSTSPPGPIYNNVAGWENAFKAYKNLLLNKKWGALYLDNPPVIGPVTIQNWTNETEGQLRLMFTIDNGDGAFNPGMEVHVRGVKMTARGLKRPLGKFKIDDATVGATATTYILRKSTGYDAGQIEEYGTVESVSYSYVAYSILQMQGQGDHDRGGSFTRARGRSSARQSA